MAGDEDPAVAEAWRTLIVSGLGVAETGDRPVVCPGPGMTAGTEVAAVAAVAEA